MGVRRDDESFRQEIEAVLARKRHDVDAILSSFRVPRADAMQTVIGSPQ
jgi:hypothetical protein